MSDEDTKELAELARDAKVLAEAAEILEALSEGTELLDEDDEGLDELERRLDEGAETTSEVSVSITMVLSEHGYVPDFDVPLYGDEDDESDSGRAFQ